jgi:hypothetical protein
MRWGATMGGTRRARWEYAALGGGAASGRRYFVACTETTGLPRPSVISIEARTLLPVAEPFAH